jgi:hypothetical protein
MLGISDAIELTKKIGELARAGAALELQERIAELREAPLGRNCREVSARQGPRGRPCQAHGRSTGILRVPQVFRGSKDLSASTVERCDGVPRVSRMRQVVPG